MFVKNIRICFGKLIFVMNTLSMSITSLIRQPNLSHYRNLNQTAVSPPPRRFVEFKKPAPTTAYQAQCACIQTIDFVQTSQ